MLIIKEVASDIKDSLKDAEKYIGRAMSTMSDYPELSEKYYKIALDHKEEVYSLHGVVVAMIANIKKTKPIDPKTLEIMQTMWDWEHAELMERMDKVDEKILRYTRLKTSK